MDKIRRELLNDMMMLGIMVFWGVVIGMVWSAVWIILGMGGSNEFYSVWAGQGALFPLGAGMLFFIRRYKEVRQNFGKPDEEIVGEKPKGRFE